MMMKWVRVVGACALLTACSGAPSDLFDQVASAITPGDSQSDQGIRTLTVYENVKIRTPEGYCIDRPASDISDGFLLAASCIRVSNAPIASSVDAVITYQVGAPNSATITELGEDFAALLMSDAGKTLLAESANPEDVTLRDVFADSDLIVVNYSDASAIAPDGLADAGWRAFVDAQDRLVALRLYAIDDTPVTASGAKALIQAAAMALVEANP